MNKVSTIGILGGMGPAATNLVATLITRFTEAENDQDHIPVITYNNPRIPDRLDAILHEGPNPVKELVRTATTLQQAGADFIIIPSNTAHAYLSEIRASARIPVVDMISLCAAHVQGRGFSKVGVLASNACLRADLFKQATTGMALSLLYPSPSDQALLMDAIYGEYGIKAGHMHRGFLQLSTIGKSLVEYGAEAVIIACNEISLAFQECHDQFGVEVIDPLMVMASAAVTLAKTGFRQDHTEAATIMPWLYTETLTSSR